MDDIYNAIKYHPYIMLVILIIAIIISIVVDNPLYSNLISSLS